MANLIGTTTTHPNIENEQSLAGLWNSTNDRIVLGGYGNVWTFFTYILTDEDGNPGAELDIENYRHFEDNTFGGTVTEAQMESGTFFDGKYLLFKNNSLGDELIRIVSSSPFDYLGTHAPMSVTLSPLERGQEGTTARNHVNGETVELWDGIPPGPYINPPITPPDSEEEELPVEEESEEVLAEEEGEEVLAEEENTLIGELVFSEEEFSSEFGIPGITIEQTLLNPLDKYSGMNINRFTFDNTNQSLEDSDRDGRIALGMFSFDDDNLASDNFPNILGPPFIGINKGNMVNNGDCKFIEKAYVETQYEPRQPVIVQPSGEWRFLSLLDVTYYEELQIGNGASLPFTNWEYWYTDGDEQGFTAYGGRYNYVPLSLEQDGDAGLNYWEKIRGFYSKTVPDTYIPTISQDEMNTAYGGSNSGNTPANIANNFKLKIEDYKEAPTIAAWLVTNEAYSNVRCLCFMNFQVWDDYNGIDQHGSSMNRNRVADYTNQDLDKYPDGYVFNWLVKPEYQSEGIINVDGELNGEGQYVHSNNQYRVLNQVQKIYDKFNDTPINPYSSLKIRFKMKTTHVFPPNGEFTDEDEKNLFILNPLSGNLNYHPQVEVGILQSQFEETPKTGIKGLGRPGYDFQINLGWDEYFQTPGGWNSERYYLADDFRDKKNSSLGGMNRFKNSVMNEWETFEFTFNLTDEHNNSGKIYGVPYGGTFDDDENGGPVEIMINNRSFDSGLPNDDPGQGGGEIYFKVPGYQTDETAIAGDKFHIISPGGTARSVEHGARGGPGYMTVWSSLGEGQTTGLQPDGRIIEAYLMYMGASIPYIETDPNDSNLGYDEIQMAVTYWDGEKWTYDDNTGYKEDNIIPYLQGCFIIARLYSRVTEDEEFGITGIEQYISNEIEFPTDGVGNLSLFLQAGNNFMGRVLIDDIECYESYEVTPDCDVRKKKSVGNYSLADLTKYYDKEIEPEMYKDTQAPLEAQFYFYPTYPTDETFVRVPVDAPPYDNYAERTPMYQDFKRGRFYIYNIDWGDGSPNEFTSNPEQIDENKALYHTYEYNGIFEVNGTMIRVKNGSDGNIAGVVYNKKFKLRININEGVDEDFKYFGSDGYSFIPFKQTVPVIGGISEQSNYYKTIKRQLGFLDNEKISIEFKNKSDKLKTELALLKMENQDIQNLEVLPAYMEKILETSYRFQIVSFPVHPNSGTIWPPSLTDFPSQILSVTDSDGNTSYSSLDGVGWGDGSGIHPDLTELIEGETYIFEMSIPVETYNWGHLTEYMEPLGEVLYNGISPIKEELGKGIGDCDLTNVKFYNKPKSISEMMFGDYDLSPEYLATLPFPQYIEEFNTVDDIVENENEYPLVTLMDGTSEQQIISNMVLWEQETSNIDNIYIPIFTLVPNGVTKVVGYESEPVDSDHPQYGIWGNQPDGEPYPVYIPNGSFSGYISELGYWFGNISFLENGKRYAFIVENETDEPLLASEKERFYWYAGAPEDYTPPPSNQSEISITEEDTIYFGNIGRPDIQDYILRVLNEDSLEDSEFTFPFTDNFPNNQWPHPDSSVVNSSDGLSDLINRKSTYVHPYNIFSTPSSPSYWKNIIPQDYSIFNREGLPNKLVVSMRAQFDYPNNQGPHYNLIINGVTISDGFVNKTQYQDFEFNILGLINPNLQFQQIKINFDNRMQSSMLFVASINIDGILFDDSLPPIQGGGSTHDDINVYYDSPEFEELYLENNPDQTEYDENNLNDMGTMMYNGDMVFEIPTSYFKKYIDTYSEQDWFNTNYYYPVLPRYGSDGKFIEGDFSNDKIPFPLEGPITDENESDKNLLINIVNEKNDVEVFNDKSGNKNYGLSIQDFSPEFDDKTLRVKKNKSKSIFKTSKPNGAF